MFRPKRTFADVVITLANGLESGAVQLRADDQPSAALGTDRREAAVPAPETAGPPAGGDEYLSDEDLKRLVEVDDATLKSQREGIQDPLKKLQRYCAKLALRHCRASNIRNVHVQREVIYDLVSDAYGLAISGMGGTEFQAETHRLALTYTKRAQRRWKRTEDADYPADAEDLVQTASARELYRFLEQLLATCLTRFAESNPAYYAVVHAVIYLPVHRVEKYTKTEQKRALLRFREELLAECERRATSSSPDRQRYAELGDLLLSTRRGGSTRFWEMLESKKVVVSRRLAPQRSHLRGDDVAPFGTLIDWFRGWVREPATEDLRQVIEVVQRGEAR